MQNTSIKSMTMTDRMSTLVLGITHYDQNSDRSTELKELKVNVKLEPQIYSRKNINPESLEKPQYVSGAFKDGKFTDKALRQIGEKVASAIKKATGTEASEYIAQIAEQIKDNWTYSLA